MTAEPSPRPWHIGKSISGTMSCIHDANGEHIASCFGMPTEADARLIVAAVNKHGMPIVELIKAYDELEAERDRLRDLVRKMLRAIDALYTVAAPVAIVKKLTPERTCIGVPIGKIVEEARDAIGEDKA